MIPATPMVMSQDDADPGDYIQRDSHDDAHGKAVPGAPRYVTP